jgi:hypothetical protein
MKKLEIKYSLVHLEVEARMKIAELAATLVNTFCSSTGATMDQYLSIYTELTNTILEPLNDMQINVVSKMSEESLGTDDLSV